LLFDLGGDVDFREERPARTLVADIGMPPAQHSRWVRA